jgi:FtsP/CotA-like multicopper oxidase with cupredoxin domain
VPRNDEGHAQHDAFLQGGVDFVADNPGDTLFHSLHQDHQDEGFMGLIRYGERGPN